MELLEKSSLILLKLCSGDEYKKASDELKSIKRSCLNDEKSVSKNLEKELEDRKEKGLIEMETYNIIKKNKKEIINYYKKCLESEVRRGNKPKKCGEIECAICLSLHNISEVLYIERCEHEFGKDCLKEWLKVSDVCPLCRRSASTVCEYGEKSKKGESIKDDSIIYKIKCLLGIK